MAQTALTDIFRRLLATLDTSDPLTGALGNATPTASCHFNLTLHTTPANSTRPRASFEEPDGLRDTTRINLLSRL